MPGNAARLVPESLQTHGVDPNLRSASGAGCTHFAARGHPSAAEGIAIRSESGVAVRTLPRAAHGAASGLQMNARHRCEESERRS